jgi:uncharacterized protein
VARQRVPDVTPLSPVLLTGERDPGAPKPKPVVVRQERAATWGGKNQELIAAAEAGDVRRVVALLDGPQAPPINARSKNYHSALTTAVKYGHLPVVEALLARGADPDPAIPGSRPTHLTMAVQLGHRGLVELLLAKGARVNDQDKRGRSPLMLATSNDRVEVMRLLPAKGADLTHPTGRTADDFARSPATRAVLQVSGTGSRQTDELSILPSSRRPARVCVPTVGAGRPAPPAASPPTGALPPRIGASSPRRIGAIPTKFGAIPARVGPSPPRIGANSSKFGAIPCRSGPAPRDAGAVPLRVLGDFGTEPGAVALLAGAAPGFALSSPRGCHHPDAATTHPTQGELAGRQAAQEWSPHFLAGGGLAVG